MTYCFSGFFTMFWASMLSLIIGSILEIDSLKGFIDSAQSFEEVEKLIFSGQMKGFLKTKEYFHLLKILKIEYSELLEIEEVGSTHYQNPIHAISFKLNSSYNNNNNNTGILFTGLHHAREPISLSMNIYVLLKILFELKMKNEDYEELVYTRGVFLIPLINVDGYEYNVILFESINGNDFGYARKNRRRGDEFSQCNQLNIGVDLNRNYAFKFNSSETSSSSNPCEETFRGPYPFSEPETIAVKSFIDKIPGIKIAYNYHSFGNFFLIPYSFLKEKSSEYMEEKSNLIYKQYKDFEDEEIFPAQSKFGTSINLLNYTSDGEASDWMLDEKGILAFSPELGNRDLYSESFYPDVSTALDICRENLPSAIFGVQKSGYSLKFNGIRAFNDKVQSNIEVKNFNKNENIFWANCEDLIKNKKVEVDLIQKEFDVFYPNSLLNLICTGKKYKKFYSITATIDNEGLESFNYKAILKISLLSKGIERITASLIKYDYSASTITKFGEIFDTEDKMESNDIDSSFLSVLNKTKFVKNFGFDKLEPNKTIFFDIKLFTDNNLIDDAIGVFDLKIEFIYAFNDTKKMRTRVINDLTNEDFEYFNAQKNPMSRRNFDKNSFQNYIILYDNGLQTTLVQNNSMFIIIGIPILILVIMSIVVLIVVKIICKRKLNQKTEKTNEKELQICNNNLKIKDKKETVMNIHFNAGKKYPVLHNKTQLNKEISNYSLAQVCTSDAIVHISDRVNTTL